MPRILGMLRPSGFIALVFLLIPIGTTAQATSRVLEAKWEFRAASETDHPDLKEWHAAQVPGVVHEKLDNICRMIFPLSALTTLEWLRTEMRA